MTLTVLVGGGRDETRVQDALVVADGGASQIVGAGTALHLARTADGVVVR